jgi:hypothetical protein
VRTRERPGVLTGDLQRFPREQSPILPQQFLDVASLQLDLADLGQVEELVFIIARKSLRSRRGCITDIGITAVVQIGRFKKPPVESNA